jgi:hypothetical protein
LFFIYSQNLFIPQMCNKLTYCLYLFSVINKMFYLFRSGCHFCGKTSGGSRINIRRMFVEKTAKQYELKSLCSKHLSWEWADFDIFAIIKTRRSDYSVKFQCNISTLKILNISRMTKILSRPTLWYGTFARWF